MKMPNRRSRGLYGMVSRAVALRCFLGVLGFTFVAGTALATDAPANPVAVAPRLPVAPRHTAAENGALYTVAKAAPTKPDGPRDHPLAATAQSAWKLYTFGQETMNDAESPSWNGMIYAVRAKGAVSDSAVKTKATDYFTKLAADEPGKKTAKDFVGAGQPKAWQSFPENQSTSPLYVSVKSVYMVSPEASGPVRHTAWLIGTSTDSPAEAERRRDAEIKWPKAQDVPHSEIHFMVQAKG